MRLASVTIMIAVVASTGATAQIPPVPDPNLCEASFAAEGTGPRVIMVRPDGRGPGLADARDLAGNPVDARIEIIVRDALGRPLAGFDRAEMWLEPALGGTAACWWDFPRRGLHPDQDSDADGRAWIAVPPQAGGWWNGECRFRISNQAIPLPPELHWNSPDINGDLVVDITDAGHFTADLFGAYHFRSDLVCDGVINLSDAGEMTAGLGRGCF